MTYYVNDKKAGECLAQNFRGHRYRTRIPYKIHPGNKQKEFHPQKIADTFSYYYRTVYQLKKDLSMHQPTPEAINKFLATLFIPKLSPTQLQSLNLPFSAS